MLREQPQVGRDKWGRPVERSRTASGPRMKTAPQKFEIFGVSGRCLVRSSKELAKPPLFASRGVLSAALLGAGMISGTAALAQTRNDAADRNMADRYYRAAQAGDDVAQFSRGSLCAAAWR